MRYTLLFILLLLTFCEQKDTIKLNGHTMGTTYHITLIPESKSGIAPEQIQTSVDSLLQTVNHQMSTYIKDSEISQFNRIQSTTSFTVSTAFVKVLNLALVINQESNGAFDVTVGPLVNLWGFGPDGIRTTPPNQEEIAEALKSIGSRQILILNDSTIQKLNPSIKLDFGAIAKGYGVDAVAELLHQKGYKNYLVEIGGEIVVHGSKYGRPWKIGIDRPAKGNQPGQELQSKLELTDMAMATSGDYRNYFTVGDSSYSHEIDPRTGQSIITGVASVTVLAPNCMLADAMATAIMIMGAEEGIKWVESKPNIEALIILHDGHNFREIRSTNFH